MFFGLSSIFTILFLRKSIWTIATNTFFKLETPFSFISISISISGHSGHSVVMRENKVDCILHRF